MEINEKMLDDMFAGLHEHQPQLDNPDKMVDAVLSRIETKQKSAKLVLALRIACVAASLLLMFGLATMYDKNVDENVFATYQNKYLSQRIDRDYVKSKFVDKQIYDVLKNQASYEKNR